MYHVQVLHRSDVAYRSCVRSIDTVAQESCDYDIIPEFLLINTWNTYVQTDSNKSFPATHLCCTTAHPFLTSRLQSFNKGAHYPWISPLHTNIRPPAFRLHKPRSMHPVQHSLQPCHHQSLITIQKSHRPYVPRPHLPPSGPLLLTACALRHLTHPPPLQAALVHIPPQIRHLRVLALIYQANTRPLRVCHLTRPTNSTLNLIMTRNHYQDQYHPSVLHDRRYVNSHPDPFYLNQQLCEVT